MSDRDQLRILSQQAVQLASAASVPTTADAAVLNCVGQWPPAKGATA